MLTLEERIDNGIRMLDSRLGLGWVDEIDVDTLDILSPTRCICGQLGRTDPQGAGYYNGMKRMGFPGDGSGIEFGFMWGAGDELGVGGDLTRLWKIVVTSLKESRTKDHVKEEVAV